MTQVGYNFGTLSPKHLRWASWPNALWQAQKPQAEPPQEQWGALIGYDNRRKKRGKDLLKADFSLPLTFSETLSRCLSLHTLCYNFSICQTGETAHFEQTSGYSNALVLIDYFEKFWAINFQQHSAQTRWSELSKFAVAAQSSRTRCFLWTNRSCWLALPRWFRSSDWCTIPVLFFCCWIPPPPTPASL